MAMKHDLDEPCEGIMNTITTNTEARGKIMTRIVYVQTLELALSALKNAEPLMKHYPEPVARHKHAIEELEYAIEGGAPARLPRQ